MATALEESKLSPAAIALIEQHARAGLDYDDELADAGILETEYSPIKTLRDTRYEKDRLKREVVPKLLEEAARLEEESRRLAAEAAPLDMNLVHQFFLWLSTLAHRGSSAALDLLVAHARLWPDPLAIATERAKAARRHAEDTAQQCDAYLTQTSNVPPAPEAQTLAARLAAIEVQIEKARADIEAAMGITEQRQRVRDIAAGKLAPDYRRYMEFTKEEADRAFLAGHRKKLAELAAIDVPAAEQTVTRCQQEAAAARARLAELEAKRRELQLRPESMSWQP